MLLTENELRSVVSEAILADQRQKDYAWIIREADESISSTLDDLEAEQEALIAAIESGDEDAMKDAIKDAEATLEEAEFKMFQRHGSVLEENYDKQLLNEAAGIVVASLLLAAPKIIELCVSGVAMMIGDKGVDHPSEKPESNIDGIAQEFANEHRPSADEIKDGKVMIDDHHDDDHDEHHAKEYNSKILTGLNKFAHAWHEGYIWLLKKLLMGFYNTKYLASRAKVAVKYALNKTKREKAVEQLKNEREAFKKKVKGFAKQLLLVIIFIMAIASGVGAATAAMKGNAALSVLESFLGGVKYMELAPMRELLISKAPEIISALWAAA